MSQAGRHPGTGDKSLARSAVDRSALEEPSAQREVPAKPKKVRVLIADDQQIACEVLRRLLRYEENVEVIGTCGTGPETLEAIKQMNPDLVFLDVQMPGLNGFEVVERLPENRKPLIIFVTANPSFEKRASRVRADFLLKPCTRDRIQNALRRAVEKGKKHRDDLNF
jgi:two-component system, LytTR family, response regulator